MIKRTVYHGSPYLFDEFNYDRVGDRGLALTGGFYFTDSINEAKGYGRSTGLQKHGGYLYECEITYNDEKLISSREQSTFTKHQIRTMMTMNDNKEQFKDLVLNYGDVGMYGLSKVLDFAVELYHGQDDWRVINGIVGDLYQDDFNRFYHLLRKHFGIDAMIVRSNGIDPKDSSTHYVIFNTDQIKIKGTTEI